MDRTRPSTPSGLRARLNLAWQTTRRAFSGDALGKDKYAVFISYRHVEPDRRWAVWLHDALESFVIPRELRGSPDRGRIGRVFRDEDELAASPHLSADIKNALNRSDWLVVVCSPRAVESEWISSEVRYFRELGRDNQILALLIEGEPADSFPPALFDIRRSAVGGALALDEPLAADVRNQIGSRTTNRWAKLKLLATILGCNFDDLRQREQERRNRRLALVTTAAVIGLAVVGMLGGWAELNRREAVRQKNFADQKKIEADTSASAARAASDVATEKERQARAAEKVAIENESRAFLAIGRLSQKESNASNAIKLTVSSWPRNAADPRPKLPDVPQVLAETMAKSRVPLMTKNLPGSTGGLFSSDGKILIVWSSSGTLLAIDPLSGRPVGQPKNFEGINQVRLLSDHSTLLVWSGGDEIGFLNIADMRALRDPIHSPYKFDGFELSPDESQILVWSKVGQVQRWATKTGALLASAIAAPNNTKGAFLLIDMKRIVTWGKDGVQLWSMDRGNQIAWMRHGDDISHDGFIPDDIGGVYGTVFYKTGGKEIIASWSRDDTIRLWNAFDGSPLGTIVPNGGLIRGVQLSKDGKRLISWSSRGVIGLWDSSTGNRIGKSIQANGPLQGISVSEDGLRIVSWTNDTIEQWRGDNGSSYNQTIRQQDLSWVKIIDHGEHILTKFGKGSMRVWDIASGKPITKEMQEQSGNVRSAKVEGNWIVSTSTGGAIQLWDKDTGDPSGPPLNHTGWVEGYEFDSASGRLVSWALNEVKLWDMTMGSQVGPTMEHDGEVATKSHKGISDLQGAHLSPDGLLIVSWAEKTFRVWDAKTGKTVGQAVEPGGRIEEVVFYPDSRRLLSRTDRQLRLWDAYTSLPIGIAGQPKPYFVIQFGEDDLNGAAVTPKGDRIVSWSVEGVQQWDAQTGAPVGPVTTDLPSFPHGAVLNSDGSVVGVWLYKSYLGILDLTTGQLRGLHLLSQKDVEGAAFFDNDRRLLSWSADGSVRMWFVETGEAIGPVMRHDKAVTGAIVSPDERQILSWSEDGSVRLWQIADGSMAVTPMKTETTMDDAGGYKVDKAIFGQDNRIYSWGNDSTLRIWERETGRLIDEDTEDTVYDMIRIPNSSRLLVKLINGIRLWDTETLSWVGFEGKLPELLHHTDYVKGVYLNSGAKQALIWSTENMRWLNIDWPKGNLFEVACILIRNDLELDELADQYGVKMQPICADEGKAIPLPSWPAAVESANLQ